MFCRIILIIFLSTCMLNAKMFQSVDKKNGEFIQSGKSKYYCSNCAMYLPRYYKTNHIYKNKQYCSLHCLYDSLKGKIPDGDVKVVDVKSLKFIDAKKAYYVVGSDKMGTMTYNSKYAFKSFDDAKEFVKLYGGKIVNFLEAYETTKEDFLKDIELLETTKEKKTYKLGKRVYEKKCQKVDVTAYESIASLKADLKRVCKRVRRDRDLQAVTEYLWDVVKKNKELKSFGKIKYTKKDKCPICGMFVYKYPKWVAMLELGGKKIYFDGVKDMFKYIIKNRDKIDYDKVYVTDYFSGKKIEALFAHYVFGSNVYGPMGNEFVPFYSEKDANSFRKDHYGIAVYGFLQIIEDKDIMEDMKEL